MEPILSEYLGHQTLAQWRHAVIDVAAPTSEKGPLAPKIRKMVKFNIEVRFDPMMPITRRRDDLRFLSLETTDKGVGVRMIDFAKEDPAVGDVKLEMNEKGKLASILGIAARARARTREPNPKTKLVFSRGAIAADPHESFNDEPDIANRQIAPSTRRSRKPSRWLGNADIRTRRGLLRR